MKNAALAKLWLQVREAAAALGSVQYVHVRREQNTHADGLVNKELDRQVG